MKITQNNKLAISLFLVNAFVYISMCFYAPFLSSYYTKSGLNAVQIGILLTIGPLVAIFIQPFWAILSDKTGRRKDILSLVILGSAISMFAFYIGHTFLTFFIAAFLLSIFSTSIIPLSDAISLRNAHKYQLDFSKIRMGGTIGFAIVVIFAGAIVKQKPALQFVLGFVGYMCLFFLARKLPTDEDLSINEKKPVTVSKSQTVKKPGLLHIFESKQIYFVLAFAFISQVGLSFHYSFLGMYMVNLNLNEGKVALISCVAAISELPVLFFINKALRKISYMKIIVFSCLLLSLRIFAITGGNLSYIIISQALNGLTYMTIYISCATFISKNVKPENQSKGQSILAIIQSGVGSIVGNIAGGLLVDSFGLKTAYTYIAALIVIVSCVIVMLQFSYQKIVRLNH